MQIEIRKYLLQQQIRFSKAAVLLPNFLLPSNHCLGFLYVVILLLADFLLSLALLYYCSDQIFSYPVLVAVV